MKRRLWLLLAGLGILIAGGCTLAPEYSQPPAPVPAEWPQGDAYLPPAAEEEATMVPELSWQEFFADPRLRAVIGMALENNRDLRLAALNVEQARALYGVQRAELLPAVNVSAGGGKQRRSADLIGSGEQRTREQYSIDLGVAAWEIDFFGHLRSLKDQALQEYLATEEARRSVRIALIAEVAGAYLALAADRENMQLSASTLEAQQESYDLVHKLFSAGVATELDLRQAQIPVETARRNLALYTQQVAQDENALQLLAGRPVPQELLPENLAAIVPIQDIFPGMSSDVLLQRPDIVAAEHQLKGAHAFIGAARAAFFPRIALTAAIGTASDDLSGLFGSGTGTWSFTPQIVMPIFDARTWAAYRVSETEREIALARYERSIQTAFREVADALAQQGTIDEQLSAQQALTEAAAESYRLSRTRYEKGVDSYLAVLDSQRSLYTAQQGLIITRFSRLANLVTLYRVLGGGIL
ncbi:MAG: efflux transporter outer membrane subunit [Desulfobulbaceae bacterium]|jgi:multidrug efflux system outer membrane protein|nr:efflux transporter outer membrane subunit [Desulfobulbaceae bacterium]